MASEITKISNCPESGTRMHLLGCRPHHWAAPFPLILFLPWIRPRNLQKVLFLTSDQLLAFLETFLVNCPTRTMQSVSAVLSKEGEHLQKRANLHDRQTYGERRNRPEIPSTFGLRSVVPSSYAAH